MDPDYAEQARARRIEQAVTDRMRPLLALRHLEPLHSQWQASLLAWLRELPGPEEQDDVIEYLDVTLSGRGDRFAVRALGPADRMIPGMAEFFGDMGASPDALERLGALGATLDPDTLGSWLEVRDGAANGGWWVDAGSLAHLEAFLDDGAQWEALRDWAQASGVEIFLEAGRSVADGEGQLIATFPLPGDDALGQVQSALSLFDALGAAQPPDDALAALMNGRHDGLEATLWLAPGGVVKSGLRALQPSLSLVIELAEASGGANLDLVAQVQGLLLMDDPWAVETHVRADGPGIELTYRLLE